MLSAVYPFNSMLLPIMSGNLTKNVTINGYISLKSIINGPLRKVDYTIEKKLDTIKINIYKAFIKECRDSNIKLFIVCPPYLINSTGIDYSIVEAKKIAQELRIDFFDYSRDSFYTSKPQLFADFRHLNEKGAGLFSNSVTENINSKLQAPYQIIQNINKAEK